MSYNVTVEDGVYTVTLRFAEIYWDAVGKRQFDVMAEGTQVITDLDLFAETGKFAAYDMTFQSSVRDGELTLDFLTDINNVQISAVLIRK